jgi:Na+-driven multidrug efflux pump
MQTTNISHPNSRKRYLLAKASNRIGSRIIDSIIVIGICVIIGVFIIMGDKKGLKGAAELNDHWRYLLITLITAICFFCYFIVLPFF